MDRATARFRLQRQTPRSTPDLANSRSSEGATEASLTGAVASNKRSLGQTDVIAMQRVVGNRATRATIQAKQSPDVDETNVRPDESVHDVARAGASGGGEKLPFFEQIQKSFGHHDVSGLRAHTGARATSSAHAIGARAYTMDNSVVFGEAPTLHTAAHEAAHGVQQMTDLQLEDGVGKAGDRHEKHADAVADLVVQGKSSEALLDEYGGAKSRSGGAETRQHLAMHRTNESASVVQRDSIPKSDVTEMAQTATNAVPVPDLIFKIKDLATKILSTSQKYKEKGSSLMGFWKDDEKMAAAALLADLATKTTSLASAFGNFPKTEMVSGKLEVATYVLKAADLIAACADDKELKAMQANPGDYEAAKKWALRTTDVFKKAGDIIPDKMEGIAPAWLSYFKLLFAAPSVIVNAFINIMEKRYKTIDKETGLTGTTYRESAESGGNKNWEGELTTIYIGAQFIDHGKDPKLQDFMKAHKKINGLDMYGVKLDVGKGLLMKEISTSDVDSDAKQRWTAYLSK